MASDVEITILVANEAASADLAHEHGFAAYVRTSAAEGLFDCGQTRAVVDNADALAVGLADLAWVALSHGHYDHTGGLPAVLERASAASVYTHPAAFLPRFAQDDEDDWRRIGVPWTPASLRESGASLLPVRVCTGIAPDVWLSGEIPRTVGWEDEAHHFFAGPPGGVLPDTFLDEQALIVLTREGAVVVTGCAHAGIINTLCHVEQCFPEHPVRAVICGLHLHSASAERVQRTVDGLRAHGVQQVIPGHCTGEEAVQAIAEAYGEDFEPLEAGRVFTFGTASCACQMQQQREITA